MTANIKSTLITAFIFFLGGGGICAWFTNDNDLLHIADLQTDIIVAFLVGGVFAAVAGGAASLVLEKVARHDKP
jgi:Na+-driven multidrug efflux pump